MVGSYASGWVKCFQVRCVGFVAIAVGFTVTSNGNHKSSCSCAQWPQRRYRRPRQECFTSCSHPKWKVKLQYSHCCCSCLWMCERRSVCAMHCVLHICLFVLIAALGVIHFIIPSLYTHTHTPTYAHATTLLCAFATVGGTKCLCAHQNQIKRIFIRLFYFQCQR